MKQKIRDFLFRSAALILSSAVLTPTYGALTLDRSRIVFNEGNSSISINVANRSQKEPYLAQGWMENERGEKIKGPLIVLPPLQRIEADGKTMIRIQALPDTKELPEDRESVFYLNLREIPPKGNKPNVLTLVMQTTIKVFWRPKALVVEPSVSVLPGRDKLSLEKNSNSLRIKNPTPYYYSFVDFLPDGKNKDVAEFVATMVAPFSTADLNIDAKTVGVSPKLIYVNDYGTMKSLSFKCNNNSCLSTGKD